MPSPGTVVKLPCPQDSFWTERLVWTLCFSSSLSRAQFLPLVPGCASQNPGLQIPDLGHQLPQLTLCLDLILLSDHIAEGTQQTFP